MPGPVFDRVLIGGEWVRAAHGTYPIVDPATEEPAGHAPACSVDQVRAAACAARDAFERGPWPRLDGAERGQLLADVAARFEREAPGLVDLTIAETGAVRRVAQSQQVGAVPVRLRRWAELAATPAEQPLGGHGVVRREPIGVVACITP
ncbi:MAG TPA: aldehyde dehydrogenase family protein, partial [Candidatus Binatia bacterium]|nr:aldehyde dehydrogenase family protein [Candidatus Binatia bacterium]